MPQLDVNRSASRQAVKRSKRRRTPAPRPRVVVRATTPIQRSRVQQRQYVSQGRAVQHAAKQQRAAAHRQVRIQRAAAKRRPTTFGNPIKGLQRSERHAIGALSALRASDPARYDAHRRSAERNIVEKLGHEGEHLLGSAGSAVKRAASSSPGRAITKIGFQSQGVHTAGLGHLPTKAVTDTIDLVTNTPTGVYQTSAAAVEAARGRPQRAQKLWRDYKKTSALAAVTSGDFKEAAHRAQEHPVSTALELSGAKALVGRSTGAAARTGALGKTVKRAGSTARPNLKLYSAAERQGERGPEIGRAYSRDIINKGLQVRHERSIRKGSRVRRTNIVAPKGTQRRPGRDPHTDVGTRLVPTGVRGLDNAPVRQRLKRRIDSRVAAQQRALELRRDKARQEVRKARKNPERQAKLEEAARADHVRLELRQRVKEAKGAEKKHIRELIALPDERLLDSVEASAKPRMAPRTSEPGSYTHEQQQVAAKSISQRLSKGRALSPALRAAAEDAVGKQIVNAVKARKAGPEFPGLALGRGIHAVHSGEVPKIPGGVERRAAPRIGHLSAEDFSNYLPGLRPRRGVAPKRVMPTTSDQTLAAMRPDAEAVAASHVTRAHAQAIQANQRLLADEFGVGPVHKTSAQAVAWAKKARPGVELRPLKRDDGEWTNVPRVVHDRLQQHAAVDTGPFAQGSPLDRATSVFKDVVLTSASPARWLGGNVGDLGIRTLAEGITPLDIARGMRVDKQLRTKHGLQGEQASAATTGGGLYGAADDLSAATRVGKLNVPRKVWRGWKRGVYTLEHRMEKIPQHGAVGKAMRRDTARQASDLKSLLKLHDDQVTRFAHGLGTDRAIEAKVQKITEDVIGRWGKVSPAMRRTLSLAPFAQWLGAATRYVLVTLPVHHPIKTGILSGISEMTLEERKRLGLSYFAPLDKRAPDYQMGMLPIKVGQNRYGPVVEGVRTSRMTSLGTAGSTPWNLPEFLMPQVSSGLNALAGRSFTGEQLKYPDDAGQERANLPMDMPDRLPVALGAQLESMVPFASAFRRAILEQGRPADPSSTILTPKVRKRFDYKKGTWYEPKAAPLAGGLEWLGPYAGPPFSDLSRIYTLGAGRDIEASQQTIKTLKKWNAERKAGKAPTPPPTSGEFWGTAPPKRKARPKATPTPANDFWK